MTDPTPPLNLALTLGLIGFLLAFVGLLWLRREERIRQETIEAAARAADKIEPDIWTNVMKRDLDEWLEKQQRHPLYGLPAVWTRPLSDDEQGTDVIGDRPGPMIW